MVNKKDFNAVVNTGNEMLGDKGYIKYHKQTSIERFTNFINTKYPKWVFVWLEDRKTGEKELINQTYPYGSV